MSSSERSSTFRPHDHDGSWQLNSRRLTTRRSKIPSYEEWLDQMEAEMTAEYGDNDDSSSVVEIKTLDTISAQAVDPLGQFEAMGRIQDARGEVGVAPGVWRRSQEGGGGGQGVEEGDGSHGRGAGR